MTCRNFSALSTIAASVIFVLLAMSLLASFTIAYGRSESYQEAGLQSENAIGLKNKEQLTVLWSANCTQLTTTNNGSAIVTIIDFFNVTEKGQLTIVNSDHIAMYPGNSRVLYNKSSSCTNVELGILSSLGNTFWATGPCGFTLSLNNTGSDTNPGEINATTITLKSINGYNYKVMLYASNLPPGVSASFIPQIFTPTASGATGSVIFAVSRNSQLVNNWNITISGFGADAQSYSANYSLTD
jgi:hypothetical protein